MYCYHCGKHFDEKKLEVKSSSLESVQDQEFLGEQEVCYICPRCGQIVHSGHTEKDIKSLSRAAHSEIQRARNSFASGMGFVSVSVILLVLAIMFFLLAKKPNNQYQLVTTCAEFYVFVVLLVVGLILLVTGVSFVSIGVVKKHQYSSLLKDIQNETFVQ